MVMTFFGEERFHLALPEEAHAGEAESEPPAPLLPEEGWPKTGVVGERAVRSFTIRQTGRPLTEAVLTRRTMTTMTKLIMHFRPTFTRMNRR